MDGLIINPKKREVMKDLHSYVTKDIYRIVDKLVSTEGITKTDYVANLIMQDLIKRGLVR